MRDFKKILVPTDFSTGAEMAYKTAGKMAHIYGGKIDLIHIVPSVKYWNESIKRIGLPLDINEDAYPRIIEDTELQVENILRNKIDSDVRGNYHVKIDRKPSVAITDFAQKNDYDLIVMGAKGEDETVMFRGSTTEKVIRHSKVPVFVVDKEMNADNIDNIVVPTDGSQMSFATFPVAVKLAAIFDARITLFHVLELYGSISIHFPDQYNYDKIERDAVYNSLIKKLKTFIKESGLSNIKIAPSERGFENIIEYYDGKNEQRIKLQTKITKGFSAHYEIEKYAMESGDLVAIATHGRSGLAHLIMGSTAEKVAQYVNKPVLTVRPGKEMFENN